VSHGERIGPDRIRLREDGRCFRCGQATRGGGNCHHRMRRRDGGDTWANQIHVCGTGTTGCHGWITANPSEARAGGWIVEAVTGEPADPAAVPLAHWLYGLVTLRDDGLYRMEVSV
jgi:hypothetical protein